ncbi:cache domain-containing protein, partial [Rheinheimera baltica]
MTFKNKLMLTLFLLGVVPALSISIVSSFYSQDALLTRSFDALETANALKVNLVEDYLSSLKGSVVLQASNPAIISSAALLIDAFNNTFVSDDENLSNRARQFYENQFYNLWVENRPDKKIADVQLIFTEIDDKGLFFQDRYIFRNTNPVGKKNQLLTDNLGDAYDIAHTSIHPYLSNVLDSFSFYDIFIIDLQGNIVYSVFKEVDYATSLMSGPFSQSGLATTYQQALKMLEGEVFISDYELYTPSYDKPAGFLASPLYLEGKLIGVFAAQFPIDTLNKKMSNRNGLGDTGDSFLVGKDQLLRSDSIISSDVKSVNQSFNKPESNKIQMQSVLKALDGNKGTLIEKDVDGKSVLVSFSPISFANLGWVIISEIESDEALAAIERLKIITYFSIGALFIVCFAVISYLLKLVLVPLGAEPEALKASVDTIADGNYDAEIPVANVGSVMHSMLLMRNKLKASAEHEKLTQEKTQQIAREKALQAEREAARAEELMQIKQALDVTSTNVMIADSGRNIVYMNKAMRQSLTKSEAALRRNLPDFSVDNVLGSSIDLFHKQPQHQANILEKLNSVYVANIVVAELYFRLTVNPIFDDAQHRIGTVVEWLDRTAEVNAEKEVSSVVSAALEGKFDLTVTEADKDGFMAFLARGLNSLTHTTSASLNDINRVLGAIAQGDLTERVTEDYQGSFGALKDGCNETAENLSQMLSE